MNWHRNSPIFKKYLNTKINEKLDQLNNQRLDLYRMVNEERNIKKEEKLRIKAIKKKREYFNTILKQVPEIYKILNDKEKIYEELYYRTNNHDKYLKISRRKELLDSDRRFCENMITTCKEDIYQSELILEIESIKGRI